MKIAKIVARVLAGLILLFASIAYFFDLIPPPPPEQLSEGMKTWGAGAMATVYLMPLVKTLELVCGLMFVSGFYVALANLVILPISINAVLIHLFLDPSSIGMAAVLLLTNLFLIYAHRDKYAAVFTR